MSQRKFVTEEIIIYTRKFCAVFVFGGASTASVRFHRENYTEKNIFHIGSYSYLALLLKFGRINCLVQSVHAYPAVTSSLDAAFDSPL